MKQNFKSGDLVILVSAKNKSLQHLIGQIHILGRRSQVWPDSWLMNPMLKDNEGRNVSWTEASMRPIRDNDGEDETLQWLDVPRKVTA